jgi:hypothetical protein
MNNFIKLYYSYIKLSNIHPFEKNNHKFIGMFGKTYEHNKIIATKLYFNIEKSINHASFPYQDKINLYEKYEPYIDYTRTFSNCIAIKKDLTKNKFTEYFHLKFNNQFKFDETDTFYNINLNNYKKGISVEFDKTKQDIKRYYYISDILDIQTIFNQFNIKENASELKYIEFTFNPTKSIFIYKNADTEKLLKGITNNCPANVLLDVNAMTDRFGVKPCLFGKYYNTSKYTVYWDLNFNNFNLGSDLFKYITEQS